MTTPSTATTGSTAATPSLVRPTATVRGVDDAPLDRDAYAALLAEWADPDTPAEGDRVRLTYADGATVEGRWEYVGGDVEAFALILDDNTVHTQVTGHVDRDIVRRIPRPRLALLTEAEALVVAALLDELLGVYPGEPLGGLARDLAVRLYDRLGI
jgi:hypothetical protein